MGNDTGKHSRGQEPKERELHSLTADERKRVNAVMEHAGALTPTRVEESRP